jgi:hypothetical protein
MQGKGEEKENGINQSIEYGIKELNEVKEKYREEISSLLVSRDQFREKLKELVKKSEPFILIEKETGRVLFKRSDLSQRDKVALLLIGRYFAEIGGIIENSELTLRETSTMLNIPITNLPAIIRDLIKRGYVEKVGRGYKISPLLIEQFLDEIIKKYKVKI